MKKLASVIGAFALSSAAMIGLAAPTQAQSISFSTGQRYQVIETYCDRNPWDRDCRGFYDGGWNDRDYYRFYNNRRSSIDSIASGLFGFTFGAALGAIIANGNNNSGGDRVISRASVDDGHVAACYARYKSYDARTNTFLGYDGIRHECRL